jgi:hypothetical protein
LLQEFLDLAKLHCYRKGAGSAAQAFCVQLAEVLAQRLPQGLSEPLSLSEAPTPTQNIKTLSREAPALARELETPNLPKRRRSNVQENLEEILREQKLQERHPHLRES